MTTEKDSFGNLPKFSAGDRVLVLPLNMEATVIKQTKSYDCDCPAWFWGNVKVRYADGVEGISHSWQLKKL